MLQKLKSPGALVIGMVSVLAFNIRHMVSAYQALTGSTGWVYDVAALVALDVTIFLFAVHGMRRASLAFAVAVSLVNLIHLCTAPGVSTWTDYLVAGCFALAYSAGIYIYSELFVRVAGAADTEVYTPEQVQELIVQQTHTLQGRADQLAGEVETARQIMIQLFDEEQLERAINRVRVRLSRTGQPADAAALAILRSIRGQVQVPELQEA